MVSKSLEPQEVARSATWHRLSYEGGGKHGGHLKAEVPIDLGLASITPRPESVRTHLIRSSATIKKKVRCRV